MTQSIVRPHCLKCRQMFTDEDVKAGNFKAVSFAYRGPFLEPLITFTHEACPGAAQ